MLSVKYSKDIFCYFNNSNTLFPYSGNIQLSDQLQYAIELCSPDTIDV